MCTLFLISTNLSTKSYFGEKLLWHIVDKIISWCHRWIPREEPGRNRQLLFLSLSFKCVQSVSLSHYAIGHTYFTEQMKVFSLLATSALWWFVSHQDDLKDMAWGERHHSAHSGPSCDHMLSCFCVQAWRRSRTFVWMYACICHMSFETCGLTSMQTLWGIRVTGQSVKRGLSSNVVQMSQWAFLSPGHVTLTWGFTRQVERKSVNTKSNEGNKQWLPLVC